VGSTPHEIIEIVNSTDLSSHTMTVGSTQLLTEMSTRNLPGRKGLPGRKADKLTAIREPIFYKMWEPRRLTNIWAQRPNTGIALSSPFQ
jgi:hypothetical protein